MKIAIDKLYDWSRKLDRQRNNSTIRQVDNAVLNAITALENLEIVARNAKRLHTSIVLDEILETYEGGHR